MVLSKDQYMEAIKNLLGDDTSENSLSLLEDLTDTFESVSAPTVEDEYKSKYEDLQKKYKSRFFEPSEKPQAIIEDHLEEPENPDAGVPMSDLFKHE